jgi:hypothetical protein
VVATHSVFRTTSTLSTERPPDECICASAVKVDSSTRWTVNHPPADVVRRVVRTEYLRRSAAELATACRLEPALRCL